MNHNALGVIGGNHCPTSFLESMRPKPLCLVLKDWRRFAARPFRCQGGFKRKSPDPGWQRIGAFSSLTCEVRSFCLSANRDEANLTKASMESITDSGGSIFQRANPYGCKTGGPVKFFCAA